MPAAFRPAVATASARPGDTLSALLSRASITRRTRSGSPSGRSDPSALGDVVQLAHGQLPGQVAQADARYQGVGQVGHGGLRGPEQANGRQGNGPKGDVPRLSSVRRLRVTILR